MANEADEITKPTTYYAWFAVLVALTLVAVGVSFTDWGPLRVVINLAIAVTQASILSLYFMHLRKADRMTWLTAGAAIFWLLILFSLLLTDYFTRQYAAL
jgi:caa(3)-type oxidase subunit IV